MANDLAISTDRAPVLAAHWSKLEGVRDLEHFKTAALVDQRSIASIRSELTRVVQPCSKSEASKIAGLLLGSYPRHNLDEPEIWSRGMVALFEEYPASIASKAADLVTKKCRFIPNRADVFEVLEALMSRLRWVQFVADRTEAERARRKQDAIDRETAQRDRAAFLAKHDGKSPLDVLREKGLFTAKVEDNGISDQTETGSGVPGRPGEHGKFGDSDEGGRGGEGGDQDGGRHAG